MSLNEEEFYERLYSDFINRERIELRLFESLSNMSIYRALRKIERGVTPFPYEARFVYSLREGIIKGFSKKCSRFGY